MSTSKIPGPESAQPGIASERAAAKSGTARAKTPPRKPTNAKKSGRAEPRKSTRLPAVIEAALDLDVTRLPLRQQLFIAEFVECGNGTQAAIRAGYLASDAASRASKLLVIPMIKAIVQARVDDKIEAVRATRDQVLSTFADIVEADATELTAYHRYPCRYCHGITDKTTGGRTRQYTPGEWIERREKHENRRSELIAAGKGDICGFNQATPNAWYDQRLPIDSACPECFGLGVGQVVIKDTRHLSRRARSLLAGVRETKDGIEVKMHNRESALAVLAKHHRLYEDLPAVNMTFDVEMLEAKFGAAMRASAVRMEQMRKERAEAREQREALALGFGRVAGMVRGV